MTAVSLNQKIENAVNWIDALWEDDYDQTTGTLGSVTRGFCCLGVCDYVNDLDEPESDCLGYTYPDVGLLQEDGSFRQYLEVFDEEANSLVFLNDDSHWIFPQIAILLSHFPENIFEWGVAKGIKKHYDKCGYPGEYEDDDDA